MQDATNVYTMPGLLLTSRDAGKPRCQQVGVQKEMGESAVQLDVQPTPEYIRRQPVDLFALLAHQLRTYMTYIGMTAEAMQNGYSDFMTPQEGLQFIQDQAEKSADVLEQGLLLVRILTEGPFLLERLSLSSVVDNVLEGFEACYADRPISIDLPEDDSVLGNQLMIELILENLVQNALVHSGQNSHVSITAEIQNDMMIVNVIDDGKGIAPEQVGKIFHSSGQRIAAGSLRSIHGMGLLLTRMAVESQGGQIWLESQLYEGSRFSFSLRKSLDD